MALYLSLDNHYDTTKLIKFPKIGLFFRLYLWLMIPVSAVRVMVETIMRKQDKNTLHDGKRESFTGRKLVTIGNQL